MSEELETILRLVAEGTLTPEDAAPIVAALSERHAPQRITDIQPTVVQSPGEGRPSAAHPGRGAGAHRGQPPGPPVRWPKPH